MNVVLITTASRPEFLKQSLASLKANAANWSRHHLTVVVDNPANWGLAPVLRDFTCIVNPSSQGASAARNIGASSIPKYRRQSHIMFIDDDVYMLPDWDTRLEATMEHLQDAVVSGHAHPYNQPLGSYDNGDGVKVSAAGVLSTVHMAMPWSIWDDVGFFVEPGGPGGSEDVEWCKRAVDKGYGLAVTSPMSVMHCGLTSSSGKQIVGYDLMMGMNSRLAEEYGLMGPARESKVFFG
jgi:GT2 family glycosyltransferase